MTVVLVVVVVVAVVVFEVVFVGVVGWRGNRGGGKCARTHGESVTQNPDGPSKLAHAAGEAAPLEPKRRTS